LRRQGRTKGKEGVGEVLNDCRRKGGDEKKKRRRRRGERRVIAPRSWRSGSDDRKKTKKG
jgi:hypothetical protein